MAIPCVLLAALFGPGTADPTGPEDRQVSAARATALPFADLREAREHVAGVIRQSNREAGHDRPNLVPAAVDIYRRLSASNELAPAERRRLQARLHARLVELRAVLERRVARERHGAHAGGGAGPAQELIDLIQSTIAPESWAVNGGKGTILFYQPQNALVVRQTAEAHEQLGSVLQQLRR